MKWNDHLKQSYSSGFEAGKQSTTPSLGTSIGMSLLGVVVTVAVDKVWNDTEFGKSCQRGIHDAVDSVRDFFGW